MLSTIGWNISVWWTVVCILATSASIILVRRLFRRRKYQLAPGPTGLPVFGTVGIDTHRSLSDHRQKYGDVSYINVLSSDFVVLNSPNSIRDALQGAATADVFGSRSPTFFERYIIGYEDVIYRCNKSNNWNELRQVFLKVLKHCGNGHGFLEKKEKEELDGLIRLMNENVGEDVDMKSYTELFVANILCILLIGQRFPRKHVKMSCAIEMLKLIRSLTTILMDLILYYFPVIGFLPFGPGSRYLRLRRVKKIVLGFLYDDYTKLTSSDLASRNGIVFELLTLHSENSWLKETYVKGLILDTFVAGFLSTESSLRAFFLIMLHYPEVQAKIQREIDEVVGDRRPNIKDRPNLPYANAAILEHLRYSSIVPLSLPHACTKDTNFHGYTVPRATILIPNFFHVHHDGSLWKEPSQFQPSRFLDVNGDLLPPSHPIRRNVFAFGVGKRRCLGENFVKLRMFLCITSLLQSFTFKPTNHLPSCDPFNYTPEAVLDPPDYKVKIERRKKTYIDSA